MTADITVLTCGALRLSLPAAAATPSVSMRPGSSAVQICFRNFTGAVCFEAVAAATETEGTMDIAAGDDGARRVLPHAEVPLTDASLSSYRATQVLPHSAQHSMPQPTGAQAAQTTSQAASLSSSERQQQQQQQQQQQKPLSLMEVPRSLSQTLDICDSADGLPLSQPHSHSHSQSHSQPHSQLHSQTLQLSSPPSPSQPLHLGSPGASAPFSLSQLQTQALYAQAYPASQLPDDHAGSQPASLSRDHVPSPPPMADQFAQGFMPLSPPSSEDNAANAEGREEPDRYAPECSQVGAKGLPTWKALAAPAEKRPPPRPDFTVAVKQGKRVRFQSDPIFFSQSPQPVTPPPPMQPACTYAFATGQDDTPSPPTQPAEPPAHSRGVPPVVPCPKSTAIQSSATKPSPWQALALAPGSSVPGRRWGATFTRLDADTAVLLGGESESAGFFQDMCVLDTRTALWMRDTKDTPDIPHTGRAWHTTTRVGRNLFVFGGEKEERGERTQTNDALIYDTTYFTWYPPGLSGTAPVPRAGHSAALLPGTTKSLAIFGGINGNRWLSDLYVLQDLSTWTRVRASQRSARPSARSYASLTAAGGLLVLFGGNNKTRCFSDVHLLNPADLSWTEPVIVGRKPRPRTGHCGVPSRDGGGVIVYGGWDDQGAQRLFFSDVWELRVKSQTECQWVCVFGGDNASKSPGARAGAGMCAAEGDGGKEGEGGMVVFGGWHQTSYFNDIHRLVLLPKTRAPAVRGGG